MFKSNEEIVKVLVKEFPDRDINKDELGDIGRFVDLYKEAYREFSNGTVIRPMPYKLLKRMVKIYLSYRDTFSDGKTIILGVKAYFINAFTTRETEDYWDARFKSILGY